jgi:hypothetical protein
VKEHGLGIFCGTVPGYAGNGGKSLKVFRGLAYKRSV